MNIFYSILSHIYTIFQILVPVAPVATALIMLHTHNQIRKDTQQKEWREYFDKIYPIAERKEWAEFYDKYIELLFFILDYGYKDTKDLIVEASRQHFRPFKRKVVESKLPWEYELRYIEFFNEYVNEFEKLTRKVSNIEPKLSQYSVEYKILNTFYLTSLKVTDYFSYIYNRDGGYELFEEIVKISEEKKGLWSLFHFHMGRLEFLLSGNDKSAIDFFFSTCKEINSYYFFKFRKPKTLSEKLKYYKLKLFSKYYRDRI